MIELALAGQCRHSTELVIVIVWTVWRTLVINANSIANKKAELAAIAEYCDPDLMLISETKLGPDILNGEFVLNPLQFVLNPLQDTWEGFVRIAREEQGGS